MGYLNLIVAVFATVILFVYGLQSFSREIQLLGEDKLKGALERLTRNRFSGFLLGAVFTAVVQSSSAVTALAVALVDSGAITFVNSLAVLIGANVGTTATAWLVSFKLTGIGPFFIVAGALLAALPGPMRVAGKSVFYFGFIFFALDLVSGTLDPVYSDPRLGELLARTSNPIIGALAGAVLTALVQSSSVITGVAILLVQQGAIDIQAAVAIIVGANAGTTVTGLIASIPMRVAARRTAIANLVINIAGVVLFVPLTPQLAAFVSTRSDSPGIAVALAHLIFNLGVAAIAMPLIKPLARWLRPPIGGARDSPQQDGDGPAGSVS